MCNRLLRRGLVALVTALALLVATAAPASAGTFTSGTLSLAGSSMSLTGGTLGLCTAPPATLSLSIGTSTATVTDFDAQRYFAVLGSSAYRIDFDDSSYFGANTGSRSASVVSGLHLGVSFTIYQVNFSTGCPILAVDSTGYAGVSLTGTVTSSTFWFTGSSANAIEMTSCTSFCSWDGGNAVASTWAGSRP